MTLHVRSKILDLSLAACSSDPCFFLHVLLTTHSGQIYFAQARIVDAIRHPRVFFLRPCSENIISDIVVKAQYLHVHMYVMLCQCRPAGRQTHVAAHTQDNCVSRETIAILLIEVF